MDTFQTNAKLLASAVRNTHDGLEPFHLADLIETLTQPFHQFAETARICPCGSWLGDCDCQ